MTPYFPLFFKILYKRSENTTQKINAKMRNKTAIEKLKQPGFPAGPKKQAFTKKKGNKSQCRTGVAKEETGTAWQEKTGEGQVPSARTTPRTVPEERW